MPARGTTSTCALRRQGWTAFVIAGLRRAAPSEHTERSSPDLIGFEAGAVGTFYARTSRSVNAHTVCSRLYALVSSGTTPSVKEYPPDAQ